MKMLHISDVELLSLLEQAAKAHHDFVMSLKPEARDAENASWATWYTSWIFENANDLEIGQ